MQRTFCGGLFYKVIIQNQSNSLHYNRKYFAPSAQEIQYHLDIPLVRPKYQEDYKEYDESIRVLYKIKSF